MLTKSQKINIVEKGGEEIQKSKTLVFGDFSRVTMKELTALRNELRKVGGKFQVIKKRLLRIMFEKAGLGFDPEEFGGQVGTVFSDKDISAVAGTVYKFSKTTLGEDKKERFTILGGFEIADKKFLDAAYIKAVGSLPPREVLLGQLLGTIIGPITSFLYLLSEKAKQGGVSAPVAAEEPKTELEPVAEAPKEATPPAAELEAQEEPKKEDKTE